MIRRGGREGRRGRFVGKEGKEERNSGDCKY